MPLSEVESDMAKLGISEGTKDKTQKEMEPNVNANAQGVLRMAEAEKKELLKTMSAEIPRGIPEAEVYDRLCCLYHR
jgi:hypothetical protein